MNQNATEMLLVLTGNIVVFLLLLAYKKKNVGKELRYHFFAQMFITVFCALNALRLVSKLWIIVYGMSVVLIVAFYAEALALCSLADSLTPRTRRYLAVSTIAGIVLYSAVFVSFPYVYLRAILITVVGALILVPPSLFVLKKKVGDGLHFFLGIFFVFLVAVVLIRLGEALKLGKDFVLLDDSFGETLIVHSLFFYLIVGGLGIVLLSKEKSDAVLERLAYYDEGTDALNRRGVIVEYNKAFEKLSYDNSPFVVVLAALDNLSQLDETYGPAVTDRVIRHVAEALIGFAGGKGLVGRLHGSEFIVLLPNNAPEDSKGLFDRLDEFLAKAYAEEAPLSVSAAGISFECPTSKDLDFADVYALCAPYLRAARKAGPRGRVFRSA